MEQNTSIAKDSEALAKRCVEICEDRKAENLLLFDVRKDSILADFYLICTGTSTPHIQAISETLRRGLADEGVRPYGKEGDAASQWIVMDYGVVLVHILDPERRDFYKIEQLWGDSRVAYRGNNSGEKNRNN